MSRRAAALAAVLLATLACSRTKHVRGEEKPQEQPEGKAAQGTSQRRGGGLPSKPGRPPVPMAPQGLLEKGVVARIQRALADRGLLKEHREGELDPPTTAAIRKLQGQDGLAATGFPDRETLKNLGIDPEHAYVSEDDRNRQSGERGEEPGSRDGEQGAREGGPAERR